MLRTISMLVFVGLYVRSRLELADERARVKRLRAILIPPAPAKSIRSNHRNEANEGDERIRTAVPAPSANTAYVSQSTTPACGCPNRGAA